MHYVSEKPIAWIFYPEDWGSMFLQDTDIRVSNYMTLWPRRL